MTQEASTGKARDIQRLAVIGTGRMGETLIRVLLREGVVTPERVVATARRAKRLGKLADELGIEIAPDNHAAVQGADVILLCTKPQTADAVCAELRPTLGPNQVLVSILAGVSCAYLEQRLAEHVPVVRAMPNTPSLVGAGMTAVCKGRAADDDDLATVARVFEQLGRTVTLDEKYFDAVTGLSGSGPAFIYVMIEALAEGGVKVGLPRGVATELAAQTCLGAARMVLETGHHPAVLKDAVTTPAGCTIDGLLTLEEGGLRVTLIKAVVEATRRARELVS